MTKDVTRTGGSERALKLPPNYSEAESAVDQVLSLRTAEASERASEALLKRVDEMIADKSVAARIASVALPGGADEVRGYLGYLAMVYPSSGAVDSKLAGKFMADDVLSLKPSAAAVEIACRRWRQTSKFLPAISEIMAEVKRAQTDLTLAVEYLKKLPDIRARIRRDLERE